MVVQEHHTLEELQQLTKAVAKPYKAAELGHELGQY